ncbi:uncharacterized protein LOC128073660 [Tympanuchus pallidicinctus]|uniref:uncharacterized protein LOC128073660 n=1 Tax=Tympanuchus pallidicinctus TaxID=109042 RepID=UPI002286FDAC|nr:uncharacterized protein LOC128073660 [Tympanuchus pallidicinctus]
MKTLNRMFNAGSPGGSTHNGSQLGCIHSPRPAGHGAQPPPHPRECSPGQATGSQFPLKNPMRIRVEGRAAARADRITHSPRACGRTRGFAHAFTVPLANIAPSATCAYCVRVCTASARHHIRVPLCDPTAAPNVAQGFEAPRGHGGPPSERAAPWSCGAAAGSERGRARSSAATWCRRGAERNIAAPQPEPECSERPEASALGTGVRPCPTSHPTASQRIPLHPTPPHPIPEQTAATHHIAWDSIASYPILTLYPIPSHSILSHHSPSHHKTIL